jgi:hypothetical protein
MKVSCFLQYFFRRFEDQGLNYQETFTVSGFRSLYRQVLTNIDI